MIFCVRRESGRRTIRNQILTKSQSAPSLLHCVGCKVIQVETAVKSEKRNCVEMPSAVIIVSAVAGLLNSFVWLIGPIPIAP